MRIGFLAMSGIRVKDEKLLDLGLTLPGFVERSKVVASLPSLGLLYLAAVTDPKHEVKYFEADADLSEPKELYGYDLVAISTFSAQIFEAYNIADRLREAGVKVAMGGLHVSTLPEEARTHADHVIVGEGEAVWPQVVEAVECGEPGRIWDNESIPPVDLQLLPVPRYDLLKDREYNRFTVQTSRGCPWLCEFCASSIMLKKPYRKRPVSHVVRDIERLVELYDRPFIEFADDNTFVDKKWGRSLCEALIPYRLKWFTETDISVAEDPKLLKLMRASGCRQVLIGLESPSAAALGGIELKRNYKAGVAEKYRTAVETIQSHGITVNGCFVLGLDSQTPEVFEEVRDFADDLGLYDVQITLLTPFPGTPLYKRLEREGRLLYPGAWDRCTLFDLNFRPRLMSEEELLKGFYSLAHDLYTSEALDSRRRKFFKNLREKVEPSEVGLTVAA